MNYEDDDCDYTCDGDTMTELRDYNTDDPNITTARKLGLVMVELLRVVTELIRLCVKVAIRICHGRWKC